MQTASLTQGFLFTHGKKGFLNSGRILTGVKAPPLPHPPGGLTGWGWSVRVTAVTSSLRSRILFLNTLLGGGGRGAGKRPER